MSMGDGKVGRIRLYIAESLLFWVCWEIARRQGLFVICGVNDEARGQLHGRQRPRRQECVDAYNPPIIPLELVEKKKSLKSEEKENELDEKRWKWGRMRKRKAHRYLLAGFGQDTFYQQGLCH